MHLNCLKKIMEASKLVKGHLNNSDQKSTFVYDAMSSGCSAVTLITLMFITFGKYAVTSSSTIAGIFPSLTMKLQYYLLCIHLILLNASYVFAKHANHFQKLIHLIFHHSSPARHALKRIMTAVDIKLKSTNFSMLPTFTRIKKRRN